MKPRITMPPRNNNPHPSRSQKFLPYFAFLVFSAIFVFKVDIIISQTLSGTSFKVETKREIINIRNGAAFYRNFTISWGETHVGILEDGELITLTLDKISGAAIESKKEFLFAKIDTRIKLIPGNAEGTVSTYYLSSEGENHNEINFEFWGNSSGNPYTLHTNVFINGKGDREQEFFLWFDPTIDFHTYTILWNPKCIILYVDNIPIREFRNLEKLGAPYPNNQPMRIYSRIWNADDLPARAGRTKTNWEFGPFTASYSNYSADGCVWLFRARSSTCDSADNSTKPYWLNLELDSGSRARMRSLQKKHMVYDYCTDQRRFSGALPPECSINIDDE